MKKRHLIYLLPALLFISAALFAQTRQTILFNDGWKFYKGDVSNGSGPAFNDAAWRQVDLPHDWSIEGPFDEQWASATGYLQGGIGWYRKTFNIAPNLRSNDLHRTAPTSNRTNNRRNIASSWNYKEGDSIRISCFTNCNEAKLMLNGKSLGKKQLVDAAEKVITWDIGYHPGELAVKGYEKGAGAAKYSLKTAGEAYSIKALAE